eukprot:CAMPEP_0195088344 /NCGR_PEP_ID=MMETSP0448-20130528/27941_1 /TAXON_ID=66468 /ORGANISM="Heterocapsa triquestra, Strain CCMP 448" /LENGTH=76 /DNA_ID=CAMNT_0040121987 /DNA_START=38 /DNA_END=265 /DNA_ORIENTATION=+
MRRKRIRRENDSSASAAPSRDHACALLARARKRGPTGDVRPTRCVENGRRARRGAPAICGRGAVEDHSGRNGTSQA